ncbi:MAG: ABC-type transport auxiliary lipoprotein family protein, partial [Macromonas bipunctata]|nr:ABC-type transport auxiliary lipoprotein family protein [Macromonas bipunctata]
RNRLLDVFQADARLSALSSDDRILQADFEIDSDLRAFQVEYRSGAPYAVLRLDARLVRTDTGRIVASRRFDLQQPLAGTSVAQAVQALGQTSDALALALRGWAVAQMAATAPAPLTSP